MATLTLTQNALDEVQKMEMFDLEFARQLKANPDVPKEEREKLRRYIKKSENINQVKVVYKLGKHLRSSALPLGRLCAEGGVGLQAFSRDVRCALAEKQYWDVDVVNAQPTLMVQWCEREGLDCKALKQQVETREEVLDDLMSSLGIERWEAKEKILTILFGGNAEGLTPFLTRELQPEIRRLMTNVWAKNAEVLKWLKNQPNSMGRGLAQIFQTEERKVLLAMDKALAKRGRSLDVLIHDGGLVRKKEGETEFPTRVLREVEEEVANETGYKVRLAMKPLETTIERTLDKDAEYLERKKAFEETGWKGMTYFKLRNPPCFVGVSVNGSSWVQLSKSDLLQNEEDNLLADGNEFIRLWLADPTKKEQLGLGFYPKQDPPAGCFNLWRGFANEPKQGDFKAFHEVLDLLANHDKSVFEFVDNAMARIVQKPWEKSKVAIVVQGEEGVGKDTYFDAVGTILGTDYFYNTSAPENDVFHNFNSAIARTLLLKFEEANFQTNKANADGLKSLITSARQNIIRKGKDPIDLDSYVNVVMTTNHEIPVVLSDTDRRFVLIKASSEKRGDHAFWKRIHTELAKPEVRSAYHYHLLTKDISQFNPVADRPLTEQQQETKQSFIPYHARFFQKTLQEDADDRWESYDWSGRNLQVAMRDFVPKMELKETRFGIDMKGQVEAGILTKERKTTGVMQSAKPSDLKDYLVKKGWWIDQ